MTVGSSGESATGGAITGGGTVPTASAAGSSRSIESSGTTWPLNRTAGKRPDETPGTSVAHEARARRTRDPMTPRTSFALVPGRASSARSTTMTASALGVRDWQDIEDAMGTEGDEPSRYELSKSS